MASSSSGPPIGPTNLYNGNPTQRTVPEWVDPLNGQLEILLLRATKDKPLPSNPFLISKTINSAIGPFKEAKSQRDENNRIQYILMVRNKAHIATLLNIKKLIDGTPIEIIHHPTLNQRKCVVTCREVLDMQETDLLAELSDQKVIGVKRITKWNKDSKTATPTATLIITIQGTVIPKAIFFGFIRVTTRTFYPNPMQCYRCFQFGHTTKHCKRTSQLCRNCGQENHGTEGNEQTCRANAQCINCNSEHAATSRDCPIWIKENLITRIRVDQGISHKEAKAIYQAQNNKPSYASQLQDRLNTPQNVGCNRCKCQCTVTVEPASSTTDTSSDSETDSSIDSDDSDFLRRKTEILNNMKRKLANNQTTSDEHKTSEEEERRTGTKKKIPRNENAKDTKTQSPNKIHNTNTQQVTKNETSNKRKNNNTKNNKANPN